MSHSRNLPVEQISRDLARAETAVLQFQQIVTAFSHIPIPDRESERKEAERLLETTLKLIKKAQGDISGKSGSIPIPLEMNNIFMNMGRLTVDMPGVATRYLAAIKEKLQDAIDTQIQPALTAAEDEKSPSKKLKESVAVLKKIEKAFQAFDAITFDNPLLLEKLSAIPELLDDAEEYSEDVHEKLAKIQDAKAALQLEIVALLPNLDAQIRALDDLNTNADKIPYSDALKNRIVQAKRELEKAARGLRIDDGAPRLTAEVFPPKSEIYANCAAQIEAAKKIAQDAAGEKLAFEAKSALPKAQQQVTDAQTSVDKAIENFGFDVFKNALTLVLNPPDTVAAFKTRLDQLSTDLFGFDIELATTALPGQDPAPALAKVGPLLDAKNRLVVLVEAAQNAVIADTDKKLTQLIDQIKSTLESLKDMPGVSADLIRRLHDRNDFYAQAKLDLYNPAYSLTDQVRYIQVDLPAEIKKGEDRLKEALTFKNDVIDKQLVVVQENLALFQELVDITPEPAKTALMGIINPIGESLIDQAGALTPINLREPISAKDDVLQNSIETLRDLHTILFRTTELTSKSLSVDLIPRVTEAGSASVAANLKSALAIVRASTEELRKALEVEPYTIDASNKTMAHVRKVVTSIKNLDPLITAAKKAIDDKHKSLPDAIKADMKEVEDKIAAITAIANDVKVSDKKDQLIARAKVVSDDLARLKTEVAHATGAPPASPHVLADLKAQSEALQATADSLVDLANKEDAIANRLVALNGKVKDLTDEIAKVKDAGRQGAFNTEFDPLKDKLTTLKEGDIPTDETAVKNLEKNIADLLDRVRKDIDVAKAAVLDLKAKLGDKDHKGGKFEDIDKAINANKGRDKDGLDDIVKHRAELVKLKEAKDLLDKEDLDKLNPADLLKLKQKYEDLLNKDADALLKKANKAITDEDKRYQDEQKKRKIHAAAPTTANLKERQKDYTHIQRHWDKNIDWLEYWEKRTTAAISNASVRDNLDSVTRGKLAPLLHDLRGAIEFYKNEDHDAMGVLAPKKTPAECQKLLDKINAIEKNLTELHAVQTKLPWITHVPDGVEYKDNMVDAETEIKKFLGTGARATPLALVAGHSPGTINRDISKILLRKHEIDIPAADGKSLPEVVKYCTTQEADGKTFRTVSHMTDDTMQKLAEVPDEGFTLGPIGTSCPGLKVAIFAMDFLRAHVSDPLGAASDVYIMAGFPPNVTKALVLAIEMTGRQIDSECRKHIHPYDTTTKEERKKFSEMLAAAGYTTNAAAELIQRRHEEARPPSQPPLPPRAKL